MMHDRLRLAALLLSSVPALTAQAAGWTSPVAVSPSGNPDPTRGAQVDSIAVNAGALSVASWDQYFYTGNGGSSVGVNVERNGRWGTPVTLSNPATYSDRARTAVGRDGTMVVAWASQTSSGRTIEAAVWPAGADGWIGPVVLGSGYLRVAPELSRYTGYQNSPSMCIDRNGLTTVLWMGGGVQGNLETIDGQRKGVESVIPPVNSQTSYVSTSLACDSQGRAIAAATMFDGTRGQVWAATLDEGAWTAAWKLTGITPRKTEDIAMSSAAMSPDGTLAFIAYVDHYNGVVKAVHRSGAGWGTPYLIGKTAYVSSFAEMVDASADLNGQGRVIWKTKGGALHLVSDWKP
jgi:hypothetical protein